MTSEMLILAAVAMAGAEARAANGPRAPAGSRMFARVCSITVDCGPLLHQLWLAGYDWADSQAGEEERRDGAR